MPDQRIDQIERDLRDLTYRMQAQESASQQEREVLYAAGPAVPVIWDGPFRPTLIRGSGMDAGKYKKIRIASGWVTAGQDAQFWNDTIRSPWSIDDGDWFGRSIVSGFYGLYMVADVLLTEGTQYGPTLAAVGEMEMPIVQTLTIHPTPGGEIQAAWTLLATFTALDGAIVSVRRERWEHIYVPVMHRYMDNHYVCNWEIDLGT